MTTVESGPSFDELLRLVLEAQRQPTAVEQLARARTVSSGVQPGESHQYFVPSERPAAGEQYAFEVDLDACSGCGACVTACHERNSLLPDELWRKTGVLLGGSSSQHPLVQPMTTACHHCLRPACLDGCPAVAYHKDPVTGIVHHIDDHCIGCQYCTLTCPYDVPVFSSSLGIVRKCDMCHARLSDGMAPACAEACPHEAIRIRVVRRDEVRLAGESGPMLPAAPDPRHTLPTTEYRTSRRWPANTLPADYFVDHPEDGHPALVVMLVLTQMSVGAFVVEYLWHGRLESSVAELAATIRPVHLMSSLALGMLGLIAAVFHLGKPGRAWRAWLGWRTSWLSREIIAFTLFSAAAAAYVSAAWNVPWLPISALIPLPLLGLVAMATGAVAVWTSVMIYAATPRPMWTAWRTSIEFAWTALLLGVAVTLVVSLAVVPVVQTVPSKHSLMAPGRELAVILVLLSIGKLVFEFLLLRHVRADTLTPHKRAALLLAGPLSMRAVRRLFFGVVGGIVLPLLLLAEEGIAAGGYQPWFVGVTACLCLVLLVASELLSRQLFFLTSVAPRMPGVRR